MGANLDKSNQIEFETINTTAADKDVIIGLPIVMENPTAFDIDKTHAQIMEILDFLNSTEGLKLRDQHSRVDFEKIIKQKFLAFATSHASIFKLMISNADIALLLDLLDKLYDVKTKKLTFDEALAQIQEEIDADNIKSQFNNENINISNLASMSSTMLQMHYEECAQIKCSNNLKDIMNAKNKNENENAISNHVSNTIVAN
jgi:hypothetical protein